ncbi:helix-turn-helix transcriptional regulator [Crenobacter cavernae]|uniref:AlpA family phage regulatory protein n=1 Tax=Crenobacter cavernae TaxID=2290923 RepID=A0A345Y5W7_9NEIS|nr:AlpA family phage regulatory protein [Crenobacter cavernae]AXK39319.1 AlpA family phage regulatory protein [Crenobacter cavernae]
MAEQLKTALAILRRKQVEARTGLSRTTIYDRINPKSPRYDATFPKPISLGAGASAVGWLESELNAWIESRIIATRHEA